MSLTQRRTIARATVLLVVAATVVMTPGVASAARPTNPPVPVPLQKFNIPDLKVTKLPASQPGYSLIGSNGRNIYALRETAGVETHLVRFDPATGAVAAEYQARPDDPKIPQRGMDWAMHPSGVVVLDGDRSSAAVLDPLTLAVRRRIPMPKNTRSALSAQREVRGPVWIGHKSYDQDSFAGRFTRRATTGIDVKNERVIETRPLPACGSKGGVQPSPTRLVLPVECTYQLAVIDLAKDKIRQYPAFPIRAEVGLVGDDVWVRWADLGYLAKFDPDTGKLTTLDLNAGGPALRNVYGFVSGAGSVWAVGTPVEDSPVRVVFRIDPKTVKVTGRAWGDGGVAFIGDTGYSWAEDGGLATFDPASVRGSAPAEVVRPKLPTAKVHKPRDAAERTSIAAFKRVFDYKVSNARAAANLENAEALAPIRTKLTKLARILYKQLKLVVTDITVNGDTAALSYVFTLNGAPAFVPLVASLTREDGKWVVSAQSVCQLAVTSGVAQC